jgi:cysteine desulfurase
MRYSLSMPQFPPKPQVYLDANASYGLLPQVAEELQRRGLDWANPNSIHQPGQRARAAIEEARDELRALLGIRCCARIVFTSGATEANNTALMLPFWDYLQRQDVARHVRPAAYISSLEHPSVLEPAKRLERLGVEVYLRPPEELVDLAVPIETAAAEVRLYACMLANNENGEIFPVSEFAAQAQKLQPQAYFLCDAVQALGKISISFDQLGVDFLTLSGHKLGALAGVGALVIGERAQQQALLLGGPQESRWRAGTENVLGIISFGIAARIARLELEARCQRMLSQRDWLLACLQRELPQLIVNFSSARISDQGCLPNTLSLRVPGIKADDLVAALDLEGVSISSGAACASGKPLPSHVLLARGFSAEAARETIRVSLRAEYNSGELEYAAQALVRCVRRAGSVV